MPRARVGGRLLLYGTPTLAWIKLGHSRAREILVLLQPSVGGCNLIRKCRGAENLGHQRIGIKRNGCDELLQLSGRQARPLRRVYW